VAATTAIDPLKFRSVACGVSFGCGVVIWLLPAQPQPLHQHSNGTVAHAERERRHLFFIHKFSWRIPAR
jgi:hypothetical protein